MKSWVLLLLSGLLLAGCSARPVGQAVPAPAPALPDAVKPLPTYKPLPAVADSAEGYAFKRPSDWLQQANTNDSTLYVFAATDGAGSGMFVITHPDAGLFAKKLQVSQPFDPAVVRDKWLADQAADRLHHWQAGQQRPVQAGGLSGFRIELHSEIGMFRADNLTYLLVGPQEVLILSVQQEAKASASNPGRWQGMLQALDALAPTVQPAA